MPNPSTIACDEQPTEDADDKVSFTLHYNDAERRVLLAALSLGFDDAGMIALYKRIDGGE